MPQLPYLFQPRAYQLPLFDALDSGYKRAICIWHRRAGKDKSLINIIAKKMHERVGAYYYFFPEFNQGRRVLWDGIDKEGFKFMNHIPQSLRKTTSKQEMKIEMKNGSVFQIIGTDNYDIIRGSNPVFCVFSEFAHQNPSAWDIVRPILNENDGMAVFSTTPFGKNHAYRLYEAAKKNPNWFTQILTIKDTKRTDGLPIITEEHLREERQIGAEEDFLMQEYFCSFDASIKGAYYSEQIKQAKEQGRVCKVPYEPKMQVYTAWDLGIGDSTAILFFQLYGKEIRIIDAEEHSGEGIAFYTDLLQRKGYQYALHILPHDAEVREMGTGKSRIEVLRQLGVTPTKILAAQNVDDGIQAVRSVFPRLWIDEKLEGFIDSVSQYRKEYDEDKRTFKSRPLHDWTSHYSDALRYLSLGLPERIHISQPRQRSRSGWRSDVGL